MIKVSRDINDYGADASYADNFSYIQAAINDDSVDTLTFGEAGETYITSQPLLFISDKQYIINSTIKIKNGSTANITSDVNINDTVITVDDTTGFNVGEQITLTDDLQHQVCATYRGMTGVIIDITGNDITIDDDCVYNLLVSENARIGHTQSVIKIFEKDNITISGTGTVDDNRVNQSQFHPVYNNGGSAAEDQRAACGISIINSDGITLQEITIQNGLMHTLAVSQIKYGFISKNITLNGITCKNAHEKNILFRMTEEIIIRNVICDTSDWEDGLIFYTGCVNADVDGVTIKNSPRGGFFWNSTSTGLIAKNIITEGNGYGLYVQGTEATIENIQCSDPVAIFGTFSPENISITDLTINNVVGANILWISGNVNNLNFNNCVITDCEGIGINVDAGDAGLPVVVFTNGGIYNNTGVLTDIEAGSDVTFNSFENVS